MKLALNLTIFLIVQGLLSFNVEGAEKSGKEVDRIEEDAVSLTRDEDDAEMSEETMHKERPSGPTLLNPTRGLVARTRKTGGGELRLPQPKKFFALKSFMSRFKPSKTNCFFSSCNQTEELMKRMMISMEESRRHTRGSMQNSSDSAPKNKRKANFVKISTVDDFIQHQDELKLFGNVAELPITPSDLNCYTPPTSEYLKVTCTECGGRTTCHVGRFTFVIHTGEQKLTPGSMQRLVNMMYKRTVLGDKCFPVSVEDLPTPACECSAGFRLLQRTTTYAPPDFDIDSSLIPVTVECIKVEPNKCDPRRGPGETLYQCRWRTLGLKKRYALYGEDVVELEADESEGGAWRGFGDESWYLHRATTRLNVREFRYYVTTINPYKPVLTWPTDPPEPVEIYDMRSPEDCTVADLSNFKVDDGYKEILECFQTDLPSPKPLHTKHKIKTKKRIGKLARKHLENKKVTTKKSKKTSVSKRKKKPKKKKKLASSISNKSNSKSTKGIKHKPSR